MKVGLVGVGPWGKTLARKFLEVGHEVAFYDRSRVDDVVEGLGSRLPWTEMFGMVDAMVVAATPPIASEIALVCAMKGFPVLVTKPLLNAEEILNKRKPGVFTVDYVHLHSPIMHALYDLADVKREEGKYIETVVSEFWGNGPVRTLTSLFDYGPHAISAVLELTASRTIDVVEAKKTPVGSDKEIWTARGKADDVKVYLTTGNGGSGHSSRLDVTFSDGTFARYDEAFPRAYLEVNGRKVEQTESHDPLRVLIEEFADQVRMQGSALTETTANIDLSMSADVMEVIGKIQRAA